ncbi:putative membrane protein [Quercus suber]|uniref:Membrane protein n=1 Tax=Quercus suber TaxID=58331 RepID=A0AAW0LMW5_QUESU
MGSRIPSHQLSNGLYVSGRPEQPKERTPTMSSVAVPYTGGDIKKSGELGKMFDIPVDGSKSRKSGPITGAPSRTGSFGGAGAHSGPIMPNAAARAVYTTSGPVSSGGMSGSTSLKKSNSGPLNKHGEPLKKSSGPQSGGVTPTGRQNSGPLPPNLPTTGLITSGPISSGPLNSSGPLGSCWIIHLEHFLGRRAIIGYIANYPDSELRTAKNGQYVKVSGVVTCGNVPLESSFQKIPRCVYTSTSLYEYRGWDSKAANPSHRHFTWGLRSLERRVVDFYISDFQSGLRALVKTGCGAKVTPYVDDSIVIDVNPQTEELSPEFIRWLGERNLSSDERIMQLKEGYIKEGSTVSVMGVVQRNENVLMIVPPTEPITTGCQWTKCILSASLDGIVLRCEDASKNDVIPV